MEAHRWEAPLRRPIALGKVVPAGGDFALSDLDGDGDLEAIRVLDGRFPSSHFQTYLNTGRPVAVEPGPGESYRPYQFTLPAPNPASSVTRLALSVERAQIVHVALYDVLGRRIARLYDGLVAAATPLALTVEVTSLPAGTYLARADGESFSATTRLTVAH